MVSWRHGHEVSLRWSNATSPAGALAVALGCLTHPSSVAAVLVLLVNDHVLKGLGPGWLAGKLSDLSGLYFFPFLLAALLSPAGAWLSPRSIGRLCFVLTATWFAGVKLTAVAHDMTLLLVEGVRGPVSIARDPGDVWTLIVLLPAWMLWRRSERENASTRERKQVAMTAVAALACIATSEIKHSSNEAVVKLERRGDVIVATLRSLGRPDTCKEYWYQQSDEWHLLPGCAKAQQAPSEGAERTQDVNWPEPAARAELVHPRDPSYRIRRAAGGGAFFDPFAPPVGIQRSRIEDLTSIGLDHSAQAGERWVPFWRLPYPAAAYHAVTYSAAAPYEDFRVYDLIWNYDASEVIVALGTEGVLIGGDGGWRRVAVGPVTPDLPFSELATRWLLIARTWPLGLVTFWVTMGVLGPVALRRSRRRDPTRPAVEHLLARTIAWWAALFCALLLAAFFAVLSVGGLALAVLLLPLFALWLTNHLVTWRRRTSLEHLAVCSSMAAGACAMLATGTLTYAYPLRIARDTSLLGAGPLLAAAAPFVIAVVVQLCMGRRHGTAAQHP